MNENSTDAPTFFCQEVNTTNRFLDWQTLLHLACFNVPEPDRLVIATTDEALSTQ